MALNPGSRLGVYDVIAPTGDAGMAAVFRARYDTFVAEPPKTLSTN